MFFFSNEQHGEEKRKEKKREQQDYSASRKNPEVRKDIAYFDKPS